VLTDRYLITYPFQPTVGPVWLAWSNKLQASLHRIEIQPVNLILNDNFPEWFLGKWICNSFYYMLNYQVVIGIISHFFVLFQEDWAYGWLCSSFYLPLLYILWRMKESLTRGCSLYSEYENCTSRTVKSFLNLHKTALELVIVYCPVSTLFLIWILFWYSVQAKFVV
jgi:hypothetical protein